MIGANRSTKFGKYSLDLAIFLHRNMETDEYTNKNEIDETECCPSLKAWKN